MSETVDDNAPPRPDWTALVARMQELKDLEGVLGLLEWEDETYAPAGARLARGPQVATLEALRHRQLTDPALGALLASVTPADEEERLIIARFQRHVDQATKIPEDLVKRLAEARSAALVAWQQARADADFDRFAPHLEGLVALAREKGHALGGNDRSVYDALLDEYEPEMTTATIEPLFGELRAELVPIVEALATAEAPQDAFLRQRFDDEGQWAFTLRLLRDLGFDFEHGRQDRSTHPFTASVNERDVRVTTRIEENNLMCAISSTVHECGHALYEQGFRPEHHRTYLASAASMGLHESQSRLWENQVGLSRSFWTYYLPILTDRFPDQLSGVDLDRFWRAINRVESSFIRVDADEVTYNLHIVLRFELEVALISGDLTVAELPEAWNDGMQRLLGVRPPDDAKGCLQDIHWAAAAFGYFPTYTLGNLYSAQMFETFTREHPDFASAFETGNFGVLLDWLRARVHRRGHTASAQTIVQDAVGGPVSVKPFSRYLKRKYGAVYGVDFAP